MRLIDGDDLSATFLSRGLVGALTHRKIRFTAGDVRGIIDKQPTVDAVPMVHGEWIELPDKADRKYSHICSACHRFHIAEGEAEVYHYCPNCGARMKGEQE